MCGICGIISSAGNLSFDIIRNMNDAIAHRGPDDEGFLAYNSASKNFLEIKSNGINSGEVNNNDHNLFLGHRRLSIIDVSECGHQPYKDVNDNFFMIYNGEIYNYIELREDLIRKGYKFRSKSDTEVLLYLYIEYGEECLKMLNGMWSFVILDRQSNTLFGARDRFGVKPFYYFLNKNTFIFSSEIKSLIKAPQIAREINNEAAFDFLSNGRILDDHSTCFKNIVELEPSSYFKLNLNNFKFEIKKYYQLNYNPRYEKFDEKKSETYIENVLAKILDAVNLRLRSDVKVGSCLSGGIDSSSIVCVINSLLKNEKISQVGDLQKVFTAAYPDTKIDETKWAELVTQTTMSEWFRTYPKSIELLGDLEDLAYAQDVPFGSTTIYSQYRVMKLASENGIKVLLDGQGGDELFTGYTSFYRPFFNELIKNKDFRAILNEYKNIKNSPVNKKELFNSLGMSFVKLFFSPSMKRKLYNMKVQEVQLLNKNFYDEYKTRFELGKFVEYTNLNFALTEQFTKTSLKELLKFEDRNSMNFSIEARTPFADDVDLINYVFEIPSSYKMHNGWTKYLLREAMKGVIPEPIRQRTDKLGFATPEYHWLNDIKDELREYFTPDLDQYFDTKKILNSWDNIFTAQAKTGFTNIWRYISFAVWKKVYKL
ncbi:MAG: asparagine synthase (glutamine-hydrolyzing) [Ignavibacteria bacterium]